MQRDLNLGSIDIWYCRPVTSDFVSETVSKFARRAKPTYNNKARSQEG
jgi:hypothetical protein